MTITDYYVATDTMGSVTAILDDEGNVLERRSYDAFGEMTCMTPDGTPVAESPTEVDVGFQGQIRDEFTGLYQMGYRWHNPMLGRWLSRDPIGILGGENVVAFVHNRPTNLSDSRGLKVTRESKINSPHIREFGTLTYDVITNDSCANVEIGNPEYELADKFAPKFLSMIGIGTGGIFGVKLIKFGVGINLFDLNRIHCKSKLASSKLTPCGECLYVMEKTYEVTVTTEVSYGNIGLTAPFGVKLGGAQAGSFLDKIQFTPAFGLGVSIYKQNSIEYEVFITVKSGCLPKC